MSSETRTCPFCDKIFTNEAKIKHHIAQEHLGILSNPLGQEQNVLKTDFDNEQSGKTLNETIKQLCDFCGREFISLTIELHVKKCQEIFNTKYSGNKYQCKSCKKSYHTGDFLRQHTRSTPRPRHR